jgi:hypothetical protein
LVDISYSFSGNSGDGDRGSGIHLLGEFLVTEKKNGEAECKSVIKTAFGKENI